MRLNQIAGVALLVASFTAGCRSVQKPAKGIDSLLSPDAHPPVVLDEEKEGKLCLATAQRLQLEGFHAKAAVLFEKARHHDPGLAVAHPLATTYARLDMPQQAEAEFRLATEAAPQDANLLNDYGCFRLRQDDYAEAARLFRRAIKIDDDHPHAWTNLGECLIRSGRVEEGVTVFERRLGPVAAYSNAGVVLAGMGHTGQATQFFQLALQEDPDSPAAHSFLDVINGKMRIPHDEQGVRIASDQEPAR